MGIDGRGKAHFGVSEAVSTPLRISADEHFIADASKRRGVSGETAGSPALAEAVVGAAVSFSDGEISPTRADIKRAGAARHGGRWNPPGLAAVYGSSSDVVALMEAKANDAYYGVETVAPRLVVAVRAQLRAVLDLTSGNLRRWLGIKLEELQSEDWRAMLAAGEESLT